MLLNLNLSAKQAKYKRLPVAPGVTKGAIGQGTSRSRRRGALAMRVQDLYKL